MLQVTKVTLELRILSGYRCEEGASGDRQAPLLHRRSSELGSKIGIPTRVA